MDLSKLKALIIDDDIFKAVDIRKALEFNRIYNVTIVTNQEKAWEEIYQGRENGAEVNLIVTDMNYPLAAGAPSDKEAGFKMIERMKEEKIDIPVIICSSLNYQEPEVLGSVWYNKLNDIEMSFKEVLRKLQ